MKKHQKLLHELLTKVFAYEYISKTYFKDEIHKERERVNEYVREKYPGTILHIYHEFSIHPASIFKLVKYQRFSRAYKKYPNRIIMKDTLSKDFWNKEIYMKDYVRDYYKDHVKRIEELVQRRLEEQKSEGSSNLERKNNGTN